MNPYTLIGSGLGTAEAASLSQRLVTWHDAMVAHERRLRADRSAYACDENCAHSEAGVLWAEALTTFGDRAHELSFLRSRAIKAAGRFPDAAIAASAEEIPNIAISGPAIARPTVGGRRQTSLVRFSGGRTAEEQRGIEL